MRRLETERLILRPFKLDDAADLFKITQDNKICEYVYNSCATNLSQAEYDIKKYYSQGDFIHDFYYVVETKENHEMVGALLVTQNANHEFEVCILIGKEYRRKGYITEAQNKFFEAMPKGSVLTFEIDRTNNVSLHMVKKIQGIEEVRAVNNYDFRKFVKVI